MYFSCVRCGHCNTLQHRCTSLVYSVGTATHCNTDVLFLCISWARATHCNTLQHTEYATQMYFSWVFRGHVQDQGFYKDLRQRSPPKRPNETYMISIKPGCRFIYMCDMIHLYVWHDCYMRHDSFTSGKWPNETYMISIKPYISAVDEGNSTPIPPCISASKHYAPANTTHISAKQTKRDV